MTQTARRRADRLIARHGRTFAAEAGITLRDKPAPLWQLLVLTLLLSARISADIAVRSARELYAAGWRTPQRMAASTWQERVDALGCGGYRRYDERTSNQLGQLAADVRQRWRGDLRRLHSAAADDPERVMAKLSEFNGIGPTGASIYVREAQAVRTDLAPYVDTITASGAARIGLPTDAARLHRLSGADDFVALVAGCVRAARSDAVVADIEGVRE